ncbi:carbohydrate ABC transporter permease [Schaalia hyovaginalis]|uniref:carbohydrate ABC transporter permease n=1 Tax=Schaalia hyovaginalis TaxID=29316 RepID=UPI001F3CFFEC|nr:carbohydrate ABC transporter permease [Schaalia hyovaginalis]MCF2711912.1 carbohydrate ABC transporter permease [Schaalia hyovaginalis]MCI7671428.1 carbohydrate ABC transporter permease [Schaalia hyovaginalis]MDY4491717.1 carbohydrate ABC transporter permease [Schaalia hyovaginalis]MDY5506643.1 carbohydrate ABC transporter permease [Schaalia hyovaginalis]
MTPNPGTSRGLSTTVARRLEKTLLLVTATAITLVVFLPIAIIVFTAFKANGEINAFPPTLIPDGWTLDNFKRIFTDLPFARLVANSFAFAGGVTVFSLVFDSLAAYALARFDFRGRTPLLILIIASLMIPFQALLIPVYQIISELGWINSYLGLIAPRAADAFGIFFLRQFFLAFPKELEDAARIDGANEWKIFTSIAIPNAVAPLLTLGVYNFVNNWNDLLWPLVLTTREDMATVTSGLTMLTGPGGIIPYGVMMAGSFVALVPLTLVFMLVQRQFIASVATTGLK